MGFLETIQLDKEAFESAKDTTVAQSFEALDSGVYPATVKSVILYKSTITKDGKTSEITSLKIDVVTTETGKVVSFMNDVNKLRADGTPNEGFLTRLKSLCKACNVDVDSLKLGDATKVSSYGKEHEGQFVLGCNDKPVLALVKKMKDTNVAEGGMYEFKNVLDGISHKGADDIEVFTEKIEKHKGIFEYKGYVAQNKEAKAAEAATGKNADAIKDLNF